MDRRRAIKKLCDKIGCIADIEPSSAHLKVKVVYKGEQRTFFASQSPSDGRTQKNFEADIRRWMRSVDSNNHI